MDPQPPAEALPGPDPWAIAASQHGLLSRAQADALGMARSQIRGLTRHWGWREVLPGVLVAPGHAQSVEQDLFKLHLWGGAGLIFSHRTAAARWRFEGFPPGLVDVMTLKDARRLPPEVHVHHARAPAGAVTTLDALPVTSRLFTLLQLGNVAPHAEVRLAAEACLAARVITLSGLNWVLQTHGRRGCPGAGVLRRIIEEFGPGYRAPESQLETDYRALLRSSGLEEPQYQVWIQGPHGWMRLDGYYDRIRLNVEMDGRSTHERQAQFQADRERDRDLLSLGIQVVRYTWHDVHRQAERVAAEHRAFLARSPRVID